MVGSDPRRATPASIVVVVWGRFRWTANFLSDLSLVITHDDEIIVVDNGSADQTSSLLEWWKDKLGPQLVVLSNPDNTGFSQGNNQGAARARHEHLIFVNNDVVISGDFITPMVEFARNEDPHSITCGNLVNYDSGWNRFGDVIVEYGEAWLLGILRCLWVQLGGFDEQFSPCDFEDVDLSFRARREGIIIKELSLPVKHMGGITGSQLENRVKLTKRNQQRFMDKWGLEL